MKTGLMAVCFLLFVTTVRAEDTVWEMCSLVGYFGATNDFMLGTLAIRRAERRGINCLEYTDAYIAGVEVHKLVFKSKTDARKLTATQKKIFQSADDFQDDVNDVILDAIDKRGK